MKTVGEVLSEKRKNLGLSLEHIEKETKIRQKYLEAIEKNDFVFFPEVATVKGFIRNYALILNLSPDAVLAIFRRDFGENEKGQVVSRSYSNELEEKGFRWTPKLTFFAVIFFILFIFAFFLFQQYLRFSAPPPLEVISPKEGQTFKEKVEVFGNTEKDSTLKIDGSLVNLDENGNFKEEIVFPRGENIVTVESSNRQGKKRTVNVKVKVE